MTNSFRTFTFVSLLFAAFAVYANDPVTSSMKAYVVETSTDGSEHLVPAKSVSPNDVIEYRIAYRNDGDALVQQFAVTGPVPANTEYLAASAQTEFAHRLLVSIDDGNTFEAEPVVRRSIDSNGVAQDVVVDASDYTHVHWQLTDALASDESRTFVYRVRVR